MSNIASNFRIDTIGVEVAYPEVDGFYAVPHEADVVMLTGFCGGDHEMFATIPVRYMEQALEQIGAFDVNRRITCDLARSLMCAWDAGARYIVVIKAGDLSELENLSDAARAGLIYDRLDQAYEIATSMQWSGLIVPTDVTLEGGSIPFTGTELEQTSEMHQMYAIALPVGTSGRVRTAFVPHITTVYDGGVAIAADAWEWDPVTKVIVVDEATVVAGAVTADGYWSVDYAKQLGEACQSGIWDGTFMQGIIASGERGYGDLINSDPFIDRHAPQLYTYNKVGRWIPRLDEYRFVTAVAGHAHFYLERFGIAFEHTLAASLAGLTSALPYDVSAAGRIIPNARLAELFTQDEADRLSFLGVVSFAEPVEAKRWGYSRIVCMTDQNMGTQASDFQQNVTMRLIRRLSFHVKAALEQIIGTSGAGVEELVQSALGDFLAADYIKKYDFSIERDKYDPFKLNVTVSVEPYFATKWLKISIKAGPFNG